MNLNEVFEQLNVLYHEQKLAHAYLFETNDITQCYNDTLILVKKIFCNSTFIPSCTKCNICNLVDNQSLPSLIVIEPDNNLIKKEQIERIKNVFASKPIYTKENIYIIKKAECMNSSAFNKLLKFLEEPEQNIIAFLICENKDKVASTIISRCETAKVVYDTKTNNITHDVYEIVDQLMNNINIGVKEAMWYNSNVLIKKELNRSDFVLILNELMKKFHDEKKFLQVKTISKYLNMLDYNVNIQLLMDSLIIEMEQYNGK